MTARGTTVWDEAPLFRDAFDDAPIGMALMTPDGVIRRSNSALQDLLGHDESGLRGTTLFTVTHPDDLPEAEANCRLMQSGVERILRHECRFLASTGQVLHVLVSTSKVRESGARAAYLVMHVEDISDRKALEAELVSRTLHDPMTGLPNRALFMERLDHALARSLRVPSPTSVLYLDLNGFKAVNDDHGHAVGDELLGQLAVRLTQLLRPTDTAARLGGDEFAVLCEDTDAQQARTIADRLREAIRAPFDLNVGPVRLSAAVGICSTTGHETSAPDAASLLHRADREMYQAKGSARGVAR